MDGGLAVTNVMTTEEHILNAAEELIKAHVNLADRPHLKCISVEHTEDWD
jgi:hypothetical protein